MTGTRTSISMSALDAQGKHTYEKVAELANQGKTNKEIAKALGITRPQVSGHKHTAKLKNLLRKKKVITKKRPPKAATPPSAPEKTTLSFDTEAPAPNTFMDDLNSVVEIVNKYTGEQREAFLSVLKIATNAELV